MINAFMTVSIFTSATVAVLKLMKKKIQLICLVFAASFKAHQDKRVGDLAAGGVEGVFEREKLQSCI